MTTPKDGFDKLPAQFLNQALDISRKKFKDQDFKLVSASGEFYEPALKYLQDQEDKLREAAKNVSDPAARTALLRSADAADEAHRQLTKVSSDSRGNMGDKQTVEGALAAIGGAGLVRGAGPAADALSSATLRNTPTGAMQGISKVASTLSRGVRILGQAVGGPVGTATVEEAAGTPLKNMLPQVAGTVAKRLAIGGAIGGGVEVAREKISGEGVQPGQIAASIAAGSVGSLAPGGPLVKGAASALAGGFTGSALSAGQPQSAKNVNPSDPNAAPAEDTAATIDRLIKSGDQDAITAQYQAWLVSDPTAAQALMTSWASAQSKTGATNTTGSTAADGGLTISPPKAIVLKDDTGAPVLGPDGKPIQLVWDEMSGQYQPLPIRTTRTDSAGNQIQVTINPITGEEQTNYLTRNPVRQVLPNGQEVFVDPVSGQPVSATDRAPVATQLGGRTVYIDPDTGAIVQSEKTADELKQEKIQNSMPLIQQLVSMYSNPASRLRLLADESKKNGETTLQNYSITDLLGNILGPDLLDEKTTSALGLPTSGKLTISPTLSKILNLPAGTAIPLGGLNPTLLPDPKVLAGLTPAERDELDALFDISTGGKKRLSDIEKGVSDVAPPSLGGTPTATYRR